MSAEIDRARTWEKLSSYYNAGYLLAAITGKEKISYKKCEEFGLNCKHAYSILELCEFGGRKESLRLVFLSSKCDGNIGGLKQNGVHSFVRFTFRLGYFAYEIPTER